MAPLSIRCDIVVSDQSHVPRRQLLKYPHYTHHAAADLSERISSCGSMALSPIVLPGSGRVGANGHRKALPGGSNPPTERVSVRRPENSFSTWTLLRSPKIIHYDAHWIGDSGEARCGDNQAHASRPLVRRWRS